MPLDQTTPILVVDDEPAMVKLMTSLLRVAGFEDIGSAVTAQDALVLLAQKAYEVVISDLHMPPTGGVQLLRSIRASSGQQPKFILTTASRSPTDVAAAKHAGVDAYLLKPFTPAQLRAKLQEVFRT